MLDARGDHLAALITAEQGKVRADALGEVSRGLEIVELACGLGTALKGETSTEVAGLTDVASVRQPLGVIVGISPFNFPAMIGMWMFPMAIACGNTFVHKPSSKADRVGTDSDAYRNEIFGPVPCVVRAGTYEAAMRIVNGSPFGNASSIFTRDGGAARRFQLEVETGMVGVNVPMPVPVGYHSFGGRKDSAFGDHRMYGSEAVHFYTRGKVITSRWPEPAGVTAG